MTEASESENDISDTITNIPQPSSAVHQNMDYYSEYNIRENMLFPLLPESEDDISDAVTNIPQPSSAVPQYMDYYSEYNIRENVLFSLLPESKNDISDAVTNIPQPSSAVTQYMDYYSEYNIRENVLFSLLPEDDVSNTVENSDNSQISVAVSGSSLNEEKCNVTDAEPVVPHTEISEPSSVVPQYMKYYSEYNIRENVLFSLLPKDDVSDAVENPDNSQISIAVSRSSFNEEKDDVTDVEPLVAHTDISQHASAVPQYMDYYSEYDIRENVLFFLPSEDDMSNAISKSDAVPQNQSVEENPSLPEEGPDVLQDSEIQEDVILPEEGYEDGVSNGAMGSNSDLLKDDTNSALESYEKDNATENSADDSHNESTSRSGTLVVGPNDLEGQEQLRKAIWASHNVPGVNHCRNVSSATTGTSSSVNELKSVSSVTSLDTAEGHIDLTESSTRPVVQARSENVALSAPVEISNEGSSQQKVEISNFVYCLGSTGFEIGKAAAVVMLVPVDLAIQATMSSFKETKAGFLIGRWACARFGPRWLRRFIGA